MSLIIRLNIDVGWVERSETQQLNSLDSHKELGFTRFFGNINLKWVNNLPLGSIFIVDFRSTQPTGFIKLTLIATSCGETQNPSTLTEEERRHETKHRPIYLELAYTFYNRMPTTE